jgi:hypothetical protein
MVASTIFAASQIGVENSGKEAVLVPHDFALPHIEYTSQ